MNLLQKAIVGAIGLKNIYQPGMAMVFRDAFSWLKDGNTAQLTQGYRNKIVYSAANVVVNKLIEVPVLVNKVISDRDASKFMFKSRFTDSDISTGRVRVMHAKAMEELPSHPLIDLLEKPNQYQTGIELREHFWFNYTLTGDGFIWAETTTEGRKAGQPVSLHSLPADKVQIVKNQQDWRNPVLNYVFTAWNGAQITISPDQIMHLAKWSPLDPQNGGWSPQQSIAKTISKNEENQIAQGSAFKNGGTGVIISSDVGTENGQAFDKLTPQQVQSIRETISRDWAGAGNSRKIHTTNGYVQVQKLGDTVVDLNLIEANQQDVADICAAFGISPILLGDMSGGTENNVRAAYKALVTNKIITDLRKFDMKFKSFSENWYPAMKILACHDVTEFTELAPDLKLMAEVFNTAWFITGNEKRKIFNFDASDAAGMNDILIQSGYMKLDDLVTELPDDDGKNYDYRD